MQNNHYKRNNRKRWRTFHREHHRQGEFIESVIKGKLPKNIVCNTDHIIDASGKWILPGVIDDQVHFREPGLTHKAEIATESVAAVAGGITSFMEMPNTVPQTTTLEALEWKYSRAAEVSPANYSFYIGATNDNFEVLKQVDFSQVCGVKFSWDHLPETCW